jgi:hypothetical protein
MKKLHNFKCKQCGVFERLVNDNDRKVKCDCGKVADRTASAAKYFQNSTGRSPSAI